MTVYIDDAANVYLNMKMSHMIADTDDELHAMAQTIGLKREWFQVQSIPHYDVCQSKRKLAINRGAVQISRRELVQIVRDRKGVKQ